MEAQDDSQLRRDEFNRFREYHLENLKESYTQADNLVLTLSSALLGISISFVKDVVPMQRVVALPCLIISWVLLSVSILSILFSYFAAQSENTAQIDYAHEYFVNKNEDFFNKKTRWSGWTVRCNRIAALCFVFGLIFTVYFTSVNFLEERSHYEREQTKLGNQNRRRPPTAANAANRNK